jgi:hypothetical protein
LTRHFVLTWHYTARRCGWGDEEEADFASAPERTGWAGQRRPGELTGTEGEKP